MNCRPLGNTYESAKAALDAEIADLDRLSKLLEFLNGLLDGGPLTPETALTAMRRAAAHPVMREELAALLVNVPLDVKARFLAGNTEPADLTVLLPAFFGESGKGGVS